jgi:hypothetical protein
MGVTIYFTVPPTQAVIVQAKLYESVSLSGTYAFVYSEAITNASTHITYASGDPAKWYKLSFVDQFSVESELSDPVTGREPFVMGTYIDHSNTGNTRKDSLIDTMITPRIMRFRQLHIYRGEQFGYQKNPIQSVYSNWLVGAPLKAWRNSLHVNDDTDAGVLNIVDAKLGLFEVDPVLDRGETLMVSYYFDYFPDYILSSLIDQAMSFINAHEPASTYNYSDSPRSWDGMIAEQVYALCLERLLLDVTLWEGRLIFSAPDDMVSQLTSALEGTRGRIPDLVHEMKKMPYVSPPTFAYYDAIRMGGSRIGFHGSTLGYGKTRGIHINRWFGR